MRVDFTFGGNLDCYSTLSSISEHVGPGSGNATHRGLPIRDVRETGVAKNRPVTTLS